MSNAQAWFNTFGLRSISYNYTYITVGVFNGFSWVYVESPLSYGEDAAIKLLMNTLNKR